MGWRAGVSRRHGGFRGTVVRGCGLGMGALDHPSALLHLQPVGMGVLAAGNACGLVIGGGRPQAGAGASSYLPLPLPPQPRPFGCWASSLRGARCSGHAPATVCRSDRHGSLRCHSPLGLREALLGNSPGERELVGGTGQGQLYPTPHLICFPGGGEQTPCLPHIPPHQPGCEGPARQHACPVGSAPFPRGTGWESLHESVGRSGDQFPVPAGLGKWWEWKGKAS